MTNIPKVLGNSRVSKSQSVSSNNNCSFNRGDTYIYNTNSFENNANNDVFPISNGIDLNDSILSYNGTGLALNQTYITDSLSNIIEVIDDDTSSELFSVNAVKHFNGADTAQPWHSLYLGYNFNPAATDYLNLQIGGSTFGSYAVRTGVNNTGVGLTTLQYLTTGSWNTAIGSSAGTTRTTGVRNTDVGYQAGQGSTPGDNVGSYNTNVGAKAGTYNILGSNNTNLGHEAGYQATGSSNTFLGNRAAVDHTSGDFNTIIGEYSGYSNETGENNVFVGAYAGAQSDGSSGSVFLGFHAGENETTDNKLYIANSNTATPLIHGDFSASTIKINGEFSMTGNIGFNGNTPISVPDITGSRMANAALADLLTQLENYGLITDSTTV